MSGTATITDEYTISASQITIAAGSTTGTVTISSNGKDDSDVEPLETIVLTLGTLVNATTSATDFTVNLLSDDYPNVTLDYSKASFAEHESTVITATLDLVHSKATSVYLNLTGTATVLTDYNVTEESNTVTLNKTQSFNRIEIIIPAGTKAITTSVTGVEDDGFITEDDETIILTPTVTNGNLASSDPTTLTLLNNSITLTRKSDPFLGLSKGAVSWGDYDNDGDKDVVIMGQSSLFGAVTKLYENKNGEFVDTNTSLTKLYDGDITWVDLNKDGNIDIVASGYNQTPQIKIYINKVSYFQKATNSYGLPELFSSKMAWGDLDNDGDIDLAITGIDASDNYVFDVYYKEDGKDNFIKEIDFSPEGFYKWGFKNC